jgi:hypothetical protein
MDFYFDIELRNKIFIVYVFGYKSERPAPICDNPSSSKYSDLGDHVEYSLLEVFKKCDHCKEVIYNCEGTLHICCTVINKDISDIFTDEEWIKIEEKIHEEYKRL